MNAQDYSDMIMPSSPAPSRTRRAVHRAAAGRSGGIFERVPCSSKPYHFRYAKSKARSRPSDGSTRAQSDTRTDSVTPAITSSINESPTIDPRTSSPPGTHDVGTSKPSETGKPLASNIQTDDVVSDTSSLATSDLSEYTIASLEARESFFRRSVASVRDRIRGSVLGTSIEQLRIRRNAHKQDQQQRETQRIEPARAPAADIEKDFSAAQPAAIGADRLERVSKFVEDLPSDNMGSKAGWPRDSEKATWRFFGLEREGE